MPILLFSPWRFYVWNTASCLGFKSSRFSFNLPKLLTSGNTAVSKKWTGSQGLLSSTVSSSYTVTVKCCLSTAALLSATLERCFLSRSHCLCTLCSENKTFCSLTLASPWYVNSLNENFHILQYKVLLRVTFVSVTVLLHVMCVGRRPFCTDYILLGCWNSSFFWRPCLPYFYLPRLASL